MDFVCLVLTKIKNDYFLIVVMTTVTTNNIQFIAKFDQRSNEVKERFGALKLICYSSEYAICMF